MSNPLELMKPVFSRLLISLCLLGLSDCRRARELGQPKAVPVRVDGALELRLMSFNVRYENEGDTDSRAWRQRVIGAVRMIREEAPDVIGVQEALHGQVADLWASLPEYEFFGVGRDDGKREGEYSGIFYQRDRFERDLSDSGTFWLSDTPEQPGSKTWGNEIPRVATWIRLVDRATQRGFYVFNTHWDHRNQESRERAALSIAKRIDSRKFPELPVVVLGDFNAVEGNPGVAYFSGKHVNLSGRDEVWTHRMIDAFQARNPNEPNRTTLHFWEGTRKGTRKVDHILVSEGARVLDAGIRDRDQPTVSDHFPVTARVIFP